MGRSRLGWACTAIAPWCLGMGLVVSITAEAGQDRSLGMSTALQASADAPISMMRDAVLASSPRLPGDVFDRASAETLGREARLTLGSPDDLKAVDDEIDPKTDLKLARGSAPEINRSQKGDPFIGLRPGFDAHLNHRNAPVMRAMGSEFDIPVDETAADAPTTPANEGVSAAMAPQLAADLADGGKSFDDGATPGLPLDVALNSSTPTPNDGVRIVIAAKAAPETTLVAKSTVGGKPDYASLIDPKDTTRQMQCLAEAVYFEARSEPEDGQAAVAQVVLNRVRSGIFPANICGVVYQDRNRPFACQFSFACEGKSLRVEEPGPWAVAVRIAKDVANGAAYNPQVADAVNYHANYVTPYWAHTLQRVDRIGHHIFYRLRIGQN
jgi:spore germination cell wall hydrolase CwlJ-like protein